MKCPTCSYVNNSDNRFCTECGTPLPMAPSKVCHNGHVYDASLQSCPYCPSPQLQSKLGSGSSSSGRDNDATRIIDSVSASSSPNKTVILSNENSSSENGSARAARKLVGWLVTFSWSDKGDDYRLYEGRNIIGGDDKSDIVLNDPAVSSTHCIILFRGDKARIKDELSSNGTFLNNHEIEEAELNDGDFIKIGRTELKFRSI